MKITGENIIVILSVILLLCIIVTSIYLYPGSVSFRVSLIIGVKVGVTVIGLLSIVVLPLTVIFIKKG